VVLRTLVVHGVDAALAGAPALVGGIGNDEKGDPDNGEDGEENEGNHQLLPGPGPLLAARFREPVPFIRCRERVCSRLKA